MKFKHLLLVLLIGTGITASAQDIHFSQFYLSPLNLNPAMTGLMNCNIRLTANYRNQWASVLKSNAYSTYNVSYDQKIPVGRYDNFGIGGTFWGDEAGSANFATVTGKISGSYSKRMAGSRKEAHYLVVGAEVGLAQRSLSFDKLKWGTQHNGAGGYDETLPTYEDQNFNQDQFLFADAGAGLLWFSVFDENNNFYAGAAYHHLNRADQSFNTQEDDYLYSRFTIHAGGEFEVAPKLGLVPGVIVMKQGPSFQVNSGTSFKFLLSSGRGNFGNYQAVHFGTWARLSNKVDSGILMDALILSTRFDYNQFTLGFSYDINVSDLKPASNNNGAFEFALAYKFCGEQRRGVYCPNF